MTTILIEPSAVSVREIQCPQLCGQIHDISSCVALDTLHYAPLGCPTFPFYNSSNLMYINVETLTNPVMSRLCHEC